MSRHHVKNNHLVMVTVQSLSNTFEMMSHVRGSPSGAFNLSLYNSSNERLRINRFQNINHRPIRVQRVPLQVSEN